MEALWAIILVCALAVYLEYSVSWNTSQHVVKPARTSMNATATTTTTTTSSAALSDILGWYLTNRLFVLFLKAEEKKG